MVSKVLTNRNNGYDILKTIAMLMVITAHSGVLSMGTIDLMPLCRWTVPVFFMITGYFYNDTVSRGREKDQIIKIVKLIIIGNIIVILANILSLALSGCSIVSWLNSWMTLDNLLRFLLFNENMVSGSFDSIYLWYLNALLYTLLITALFNKRKMISILCYVTPILLVAGLIISNFSTEIFGVSFAQDSIKYLPIYRNFLFIGIPYFCIGYVLRKKKPEFPVSILAVSAFVFLLVGIAEMQIIYHYHLGSNGEYFISTPLCAVSIFLLFNKFYQKRKLTAMEAKLALIGRRYVLWIYLIHLPLVHICSAVGARFSLPDYSKLIEVPMVFVFSLLISIVIVKVNDMMISRTKSRDNHE